MSWRGNIAFIIGLMVMIWLGFCSFVLSSHAEGSSTNQSKYPVMVPDTGQNSCYNTRREIPCPEPGAPFYGQDANFSINVPEYELINQEGVEIIIDHTTGLSWQRRPEEVQRNWSEAIDYTDGLKLSSYTDWRLPEKQELQTILSYGSYPSPLIDPPAEKDWESTHQKICAWTLTTPNFPSLNAKVICLEDNQGKLSDKYKKNYVYAVRGPAITYGKYQDNGNGTITDNMTGLMWQAIEARPKKWEQSLAYCQQLELGGFKDWRLPTIKELSTLVNEGPATPSIDTTFFPAARPAAYWSSTTFTGHPGFAWYVSFDNGRRYNGGYKARRYFVRAVRGGLIASSPAGPSLIPRPTPEEKAPKTVPEIVPEIAPEIAPEKTQKPVLPDIDNMDFLEPYPLDPDAQYD